MTISHQDLDDLVEISAYGGKDVRLAQGGGGNSSVKDSNRALLWVKASGFRLAEVSRQFGWLEVSMEKLNRGLKSGNLEGLPDREAHEVSIKAVQEATTGGNLRPSLETSFHAWLPDRLVLHTHSVWANCFSCMDEGQEILKKSLPVAWVDYVTPGYLLGKAVAAAHTSTGSYFFLLENHGWITSGATAREVISRHEVINEVAERLFGTIGDSPESSAPDSEITNWARSLEQACVAMGHPVVVRPAMRDFLRKPVERCPAQGALVPDDVVYGIHAIESIDTGVSGADWVVRHGWQGLGMKIFWLAGRGFVLAGPAEATIRIMEENLLANVILHQRIPRVGQIRLLAKEEIAYLCGMESEKYRQQVASGKIR